MQLTFHGAARVVTGSKHLLTLKSGKNILLDCGFFQGEGADTDSMNRTFAFDASKIDVLVLTHAHIDHSGNIPNLVKNGFKGKIYCTPATKELCAIMLADTAHILESDLAYVNRHYKEEGKQPIPPIYNMEDVLSAMKLFIAVPYQTKQTIADGVDLIFTNSGHILGAAATNLTINEDGEITRLTFTGDIGRPSDHILKKPEAFPQSDILICESTYGNSLHDSQEKTEDRLQQIVYKTCVENQGKLIIPSFSLGRTQEVVYALNNLRNAKKLPSIPVYVDSPLSINATNIMRAHPEYFNDDILNVMKTDPDPFGFDTLTYIQSADESIKLNSNHSPMIIISASGMAEAGRIKHHIKNNILNPANTILMVGFCTRGSLGGRLIAREKQVHIFGKLYDVKANVEVMNSYSAHGDYNEMLQYLSCQDPSKIKKMFLVHGEYKVQIPWRDRLMQHGFSSIEIPELHSSWEI